MRIAIFSVGSQGDVRPLAALGAGLARAGHRVTLVTLEAFRELALSCGLEFAAIDIDPFAFIRGDTGQAWMSSMDSPLRLLRGVSKAAGQFLGQLNDAALAACRGCEALLYTVPLSISGYTIAEALGVPGIPTAVAPYHPSSRFPSLFLPSLPVHGRFANALSSTAVIQVFWTMIRSHLNRWRHSRPALAPLPARNPLAAMHKAGVPWLYGFSPSVVPFPADWPSTVFVCGYWFTPAVHAWKPPEELLDFIESGPAPVYVGFGSMVGADPPHTARTVLEALEKTGQRAIFASGWGGMEFGRLPDTAFAVHDVPHEWLFPRMAAVVHHGGAGTTAAALRAGVPSVVVPYFYDQLFWGQRLYSLGVGSRPIRSRDLEATRLEQAIRTALDAPGIRERCRVLAERINAENGVQRAVAVVEHYLRSVMR
jgi:UDP:flavonoid glycosyltransferase YjiC (YdhE family)